MKTPRFVVTILAATLCLLLIVLSVGCNEGKADPKAEAPPKAAAFSVDRCAKAIA